MNYPRPYQAFGRFLVTTTIAASFVIALWGHGWWQLISFSMIFVAIDDGSDWLGEIDKSRHWDEIRKEEAIAEAHSRLERLAEDD